MILILFILIRENLNLIEDKNYSSSKKESEEICNKTTVLDEGLICCNSTICDKYCYNYYDKDYCIASQKVWICFKDSSISLLLLIRSLISLIFFLFSSIKKSCPYYNVTYWFSFIFLSCEIMQNMFIIELIRTIYCNVKDHKYFVNMLFYCFNYLLFLTFTFIFIYLLIFGILENDNFKILKTIIFRPTLYKIQIILECLIIILSSLFSCFCIMDFFMFFISKNYREKWKLEFFKKKDYNHKNNNKSTKNNGIHINNPNEEEHNGNDEEDNDNNVNISNDNNENNIKNSYYY